MVVLAIVASLAAIGIGGLTVLRTTVLLNQATNEMVALLRLTQSRARNGAISETRFRSTGSMVASRADGFAFYVDGSTTFSIRYCYASGATGNINYNCTGIEAPLNTGLLIPNGLSELTIESVNTSVCRGAVVSRLSGNWSGISSTTSSPARETGNCVIRLTHTQLGQSRDVVINLGENNVEIL